MYTKINIYVAFLFSIKCRKPRRTSLAARSGRSGVWSIKSEKIFQE
ncbi:hypothetical protein HMPREF0880_02907 [Yokenella regensburgei ATCC 43003]|nr:hypothetical protein HMPREF0880_02907 [Yokenella regensburgei ATCC 43003]